MNQPIRYKLPVRFSLWVSVLVVVFSCFHGAVEAQEITSISTLKSQVDENLSPTDTETIVNVEGIVTSPLNLTGSSNGLFYMQDETGGIAVFHAGAGGTVPAQGDRVRVTAPVGFFNGLLQLAPSASNTDHKVEVLSSGNELPAAWTVDFAEVGNPTIMEARESGLAIARGVTISHDSATYPRSGNLTITDGEGRTLTLRIDSRTDFDGTDIPSEPVDITGVIGQFDNSSPYTEGYQLLPFGVSSVVDPNQVVIEVTPISALKSQVDENLSPTDTETIVNVEGIVTSPLNLTGSSNGLFYMQDETGGIAVFHAGAGGTVPAQGDRVRVTAPVGFFNGLLQLAPSASNTDHKVEVLSSGNELPAAWTVDFAEVGNPTIMEAQESGLAIARGVTISHDSATYPRSGNLTITDGEGRTLTLRIDSRTDFDGTDIPSEPVDITGVIGQFDNSSPYTEGYQLLPFGVSSVVDPNQVVIEVTPISALKSQVDENLSPTDTETIVNVEGIVTSPLNLTGSSNGLFYMQDETGGIAVFHAGAGGTVPAQGDRVRVTAPVGFFNGLLQLAPSASNTDHKVEVLSSGNELPAAWTVDFAEVGNPTIMEARESGLAIARGVTISHDSATYPRSGNLTITDGEGRTLTLRIDSRTDFDGTDIPSEPVDITGVIGQFDNSSPYTEGYQLLPFGVSSVVDPNQVVIEVTPISTLKSQVDENLSPTDTETIVNVEGIVTSPLNLTGSSNGLFYMQDETGGIAVFHAGAGGTVPAQGDRVRVTAPVGFFNGLLQLAPSASNTDHKVEVLSSGNELPEAWTVDFAEVGNPTIMEARESGLAIARGVTISHDSATYPRSGNLTITDGEGRTLTLRIDSRTDFDGADIPSEPVDITGVIGQFDNSPPHTEGYQLLPFGVSSVDQGNDPGLPLTSIEALRGILDPETYTPTDTETLFRAQGIVTTRINLTTTSNGLFYMQSEGFGIAVFNSGASGSVPAYGDLVEVIAPLAHFNGLLELVPASGNATHSVTVISSGNEAPEPVDIDFSRLDDVEYFESIEGLLVQATDIEIVSDESVFPTSGNFVLNDATGNPLDSNGFSLRIDSRTDIGGQAIPEGTASIIGVLAQFDNSDPRTSGYQILPGRFEDVISDNKAPIVNFNVAIRNQVRLSEPDHSSFDEYALIPGETIIIEAVANDFQEGGVITLAAAGETPDGAAWAIPSSEGTSLTAEFSFTPTTEHEGTLFLVSLTASNANAENNIVWRLYVPSASEQKLLLTEFLANPADDPESLHYNPLNRDLEFVEDYQPWTWDEFVELANLGTEPVNLGGWSIGDANEIRHQFFESFILEPNEAGIIYGGPLNGAEPQLDGIQTASASSDRFGFGLNNSGGDMIRIYNADGNLVQRVVYTNDDVSDEASVVPAPDAHGGLSAHNLISSLPVSPGFWINGNSFEEHEFIVRVADINPTASLSGENTLLISWEATPGVAYEVLASTDLAEPFTVLEQNLVFEDASGEYSAPLTSDFRFFVIQLQ